MLIWLSWLFLQTYLATYFTFVDAILIVQFWYYGRKHRYRLRHAHHHPHHSHQASRQGSQYLYQPASRSRPSHSRTRSARSGITYSRPGSMAASFVGADGSRTPDHKVRSLSPYTLEDSQTLVRFQETPAAFPPESSTSRRDQYSRSRSHSSSDSEDVPPEMSESITSKKSDASSSTIGALARGRSIYRPSTSASAPDVRAGVIDDGNGTIWRQLSGSRPRGVTGPRDRPSQSRTRSVVFLSIWAFIGLGGLYSRSSALMPRAASNKTSGAAWKVTMPRGEVEAYASSYAAAATILDNGLPPPPIDYSLLVGRVAAWLCVCFYLTSRMPQICQYQDLGSVARKKFANCRMYTGKNFRRQSVEVCPERSIRQARVRCILTLTVHFNSPGPLYSAVCGSFHGEPILRSEHSFFSSRRRGRQ